MNRKLLNWMIISKSGAICMFSSIVFILVVHLILVLQAFPLFFVCFFFHIYILTVALTVRSVTVSYWSSTSSFWANSNPDHSPDIAYVFQTTFLSEPFIPTNSFLKRQITIKIWPQLIWTQCIANFIFRNNNFIARTKNLCWNQCILLTAI